jgi:hypothetical protein
MKANLDQVLDQIKTLSPGEVEQLLETVHEIVLTNRILGIDRPPPSEEEIERFRNYKPIKVEGKPVSETIIEERG